MNKNKHPFWLHVSVFILMASVALFFILFIFNQPGAKNGRFIIPEICGLASASFLMYRIILGSGYEGIGQGE